MVFTKIEDLIDYAQEYVKRFYWKISLKRALLFNSSMRKNGDNYDTTDAKDGHDYERLRSVLEHIEQYSEPLQRYTIEFHLAPGSNSPPITLTFEPKKTASVGISGVPQLGSPTNYGGLSQSQVDRMINAAVDAALEKERTTNEIAGLTQRITELEEVGWIGHVKQLLRSPEVTAIIGSLMAGIIPRPRPESYTPPTPQNPNISATPSPDTDDALNTALDTIEQNCGIDAVQMCQRIAALSAQNPDLIKQFFHAE
jgi:hypothetical protein